MANEQQQLFLSVQHLSQSCPLLLFLGTTMTQVTIVALLTALVFSKDLLHSGSVSFSECGSNNTNLMLSD